MLRPVGRRASRPSSGAARSFHDHHRARRVDHPDPAPHDARFRPAEPAHRPRVARHLVRRRATLEREQGAAGAQQGKSPAGEPGERGDGAGGHHVGPLPSRTHTGLLGPPALDLHRQPQILHDLTQPVDATRERFDEDHRKVGPRQDQRYPGQSGAGPEVDDPCAVRDQLRDDCTVEEVALPHSRRLAGPDQPTLDTGADEVGRETTGDREPVAEDRDGRRGRMFHVKHRFP